PTAAILPSLITSTPFSIVPWVTVSSFPPLNAIGLSWARAIVGKTQATTISIWQTTNDQRLARFSGTWQPRTEDLSLIAPPCNEACRIPVVIYRSTLRHLS